MEEWERGVITKNMDKLVRETICNFALLSKLLASGILSDNDVDELDAVGNDRAKKAFQLYNIVQKRANGFEYIIRALEATKQTGALSILTGGSGRRENDYDNIRAVTYNENDVLGSGSYGTIVFKGKFGDRDVAVKRVLFDPRDGAQVIHEVEVLKTCDVHENVVRYFGCKREHIFVLIVLELLDVTLTHWVENKSIEAGPLEVLKQVTNGMEWLHNQNIVHRDLKPDNILLARKPVKVKISDFGLSRRIMDGRSYVSTGVVAGTQGWVASEILEHAIKGDIAKCKFTFASDVFTLGLVYYYVLTDGKHAFGEPYRSQVNIIEGNVMMKLEDVVHCCSQNVEFIKLMLSKDPKSRLSCSALLSCPIFWSENRRVRFIRDLKPLNTYLNPQGPCALDHVREVEALKTLGYDLGTGCVLPFAYLNQHQGLEPHYLSKQDTINNIQPRLNRNEEIGKQNMNVTSPKVLEKEFNSQVDKISCTPTNQIHQNKHNVRLKEIKDNSFVIQGEVLSEQLSTLTRFDKQMENEIHDEPTIISKIREPEETITDNVKTSQTVSNTEFQKTSNAPVPPVKNTSNDTSAQSQPGNTTVPNGPTKIETTTEHITKLLGSLRGLSLDDKRYKLIEVVKTMDLSMIKIAIEEVGKEIKIEEVWYTNLKSLLHVAVQHREFAVVQYLLNTNRFTKMLTNEHGIVHACIWDIHVITPDKFEDKCKILQLLFEKQPDLVNSKDECRRTPLHVVVLRRFNEEKLKCELILMLIRNKADLNAKDYRNQIFLAFLPLNTSPETFHNIMTYFVSTGKETLLTGNIDISSSEYHKKYAKILHLAVENFEVLTETLEIFKSIGYDFNFMDEYSRSVLKCAISGGRTKSFLRTLIDFGADWSTGNMLLHFAAKSGNLITVQLFISLGCDINSKDEQGNTPLHCAVYNNTNKTAIVSELLENRANACLKNNSGLLPVDIEKRFKYSDKSLIELLENAAKQTKL